MIKSLEIQNYRCIPYLRLENLKPINIFVGRNNTGKSSILESIALSLSSPTGFYDALENDLLGAFVKRRGGYKNIKYFIRSQEPEANIKIATENGEKIRLRLLYKKMGFTGLEVDENFKELIMRYIYNSLDYIRYKRKKMQEEEQRISDEEYMNDLWNRILYNPKLFLLTYKNDKPHAYCTILQEQEVILRDRYYISNLIFEGRKIEIDIGDMYDTLVIEGKIQKLVDKLINIRDLRKTEDEMLIFTTDNIKPLPINAMGDGFLALLRKMFIKEFLDHGTIVLEEPENYMHPGYLEFMVKELTEISAKEIQLFISTHNSELIRKFLDLEENKNVLQIIRMYREGEYLDYEVIDFFDAKESLEELEVDLRGI